jgi:hypothetical protein
MIVPVSLSRHGTQRWRRSSSYQFAAKDLVAPLVVAEFSRAAMSFPIAFVRKPEAESFSPVAVLGVAQGTNLFVAAAGQWIGGYIPAAYRGYPFRLGRNEEGKFLLCFDEASGLLAPADETSKVEHFFDDAGQPSVQIQQVLNFLLQVHGNQEATTTACDLLEVHKLIEPWPVTVQSEQGKASLEGLYRISEKAFTSLKSRALSALHKENALMLATCQILSTQHMPMLGRLVDAHAKAKTMGSVQNLPPPAPSGEIDFSFLQD